MAVAFLLPSGDESGETDSAALQTAHREAGTPGRIELLPGCYFFGDVKVHTPSDGGKVVIEIIGTGDDPLDTVLVAVAR